jgi:putative ABC transport system permease protein
VVQDLRYGFRVITKNPFFAGVAVLTLALGIGANTAIFSVVHAVLLRPAAYPAADADKVLLLMEKDLKIDRFSVAYPNFKDYQDSTQSFEVAAAYRDSYYNLTGLEEPLRLRVRLTSSSYFGLMGVKPILGRFYAADEDRPGAKKVAVLNHLLWQNRFGGRRDVIGETLLLDDEPYSVIGVLPSDFEPTQEEWAYIALEPWADNRNTKDRGNHQGIRVLARMKSDVSFEQAQSEMETIYRQLEQQYPKSNAGVGVNVDRLHELRVADYQMTLLMLLGAVSLVLLIACANVANLLLARAVNRRREYAVQSALGAPRRRLVQQSLTEGVILGLFGGALGVVLAYWGLNLLRGFLPTDIPGLHALQLDWNVMAYAAALSIVTGLLFGAGPAWFASRAAPSDPLKEGSRDTGSRGRAGRGLLVTEVALATLLLIGACLLIRSVSELIKVDPGFRPDHLLTMSLELPSSRYPGEKRLAFFREMQDQLNSLPGVESTTVGYSFPMMDFNWRSIFTVADKPVPPRENLPSSVFNPVDVSYFKTLGIPLLRGRVFEDSDTSTSQAVIVINQTLADAIWPGENPIGKRLKQGWPESEGEYFPWREVIGVVGNTKQTELDAETVMETYIPYQQLPPPFVGIALRTAVDPLTLIEPAKAVVHSLDPNLPVYDFESMDNVIATTVAPRRFTMLLLGLFAVLALFLASIGLYGVIAYSVAGRTREIGVRMAMGADRRDVYGLVVKEGMLLAFVGAVLGIGAAMGLTRLMSHLLYGVSSKDPLTFAVIPLILMAVAWVACSVPAWNASRIEPVRALRYE